MLASKVDENTNITERLSQINSYIEKLHAEHAKTRENLANPEDDDEGYCQARVTFSGSWANDKAEDVQWASSMETKRYPIVVFNSKILSEADNNPVGSRYHLTYKLNNSEARIIGQIFQANGFREVGPSNMDFNIVWTSSNPNPNIYKSLLPHQRVNHFPRSYELTRKDRMYKNIERLQQTKGLKHFNFLPKTFILPAEFAEFSATYNKIRGAWIVKPVASSRGRGIYLIKNPNQVPFDEPLIVSKYIENPLLINGHKSDLRLYVLVTSYDPLIIYLYEEGLVRFAAVKYDNTGTNLWNPCMHLCNYSINKYHSDYVASDNVNDDDRGHKWSLSAFLKHLKANDLNTTQLMQAIEDVIIKSIVSVEFSVNSACKMFVPHRNNCFEVYGFDILVDSNLKPWLLEVNMSPSLNTDSPIDMKIKSSMLCDLFTLIGLPAVDPVLKRAQFEQQLRDMSAARSGHYRTVRSAEERRHSAIRLSSTLSPGWAEMTRIVRDVEEQHERRRGWVRIFPTEETWSNYGPLLDFSSNNNLVLHEHLYPQYIVRPLINKQRTRQPHQRRSAKHSSRILREEPAEEEDKERQEDVSAAERVAQYEKPLDNFQTLVRRKSARQSQPGELGVRLKEKIVKSIEAGNLMSEKQARRAFAAYLGIILRKLAEFDEQVDDKNRIELTLRFLQKACLSLKEPYFFKKPSNKLVGKDKAAVIGKSLSEFLEQYKRETENCIQDDSPDSIPKNMFDTFLSNASETDLESVLTFQTKLQGCTHIFIGKCISPPSNNKLALLKIANNITPDRVVRSARCSQKSLNKIKPGGSRSQLSSTSCLDIQTEQ